jgi:hypothetical protein
MELSLLVEAVVEEGSLVEAEAKDEAMVVVEGEAVVDKEVITKKTNEAYQEGVVGMLNW